MKYTIDRFEGEFAVVELSEGRFANIPRVALPGEAKEGDVLDVSIDETETNQRRNNIEKLMNSVWAD